MSKKIVDQSLETDTEVPIMPKKTAPKFNAMMSCSVARGVNSVGLAAGMPDARVIGTIGMGGGGGG